MATLWIELPQEYEPEHPAMLQYHFARMNLISHLAEELGLSVDISMNHWDNMQITGETEAIRMLIEAYEQTVVDSELNVEVSNDDDLNLFKGFDLLTAVNMTDDE